MEEAETSGIRIDRHFPIAASWWKKKCDTTEAGGIVQERNVKRPESIAGLAMDLSLNGLVKRSVNCSNFKMFSRSKCHKISVWRDFADDRLAVIDSAGRGDFK